MLKSAFIVACSLATIVPGITHAWVVVPTLSTTSSSNRHHTILHAETLLSEDLNPAKDSEESIHIEDRSQEDAKFRRCDESVGRWRRLLSEGDTGNFQRVLKEGSETVLQSTTPLDRAYWSSSGLRTGFFGLVALLGNSRAGERGLQMDQSFRLYEIFLCYQQELNFVKNGQLDYPWDFVAQASTSRDERINNVRLQLDHRQFQPGYFVPQALSLLGEIEKILDRRERHQGKPHQTSWPTNHVSRSSSSKSDGELTYPEYYLNDFHYQTDGWLSESSANRYEMSTETIFVGSQDVMQRQTILPLKNAVKTNNKNSISNILEVACGTGRFATFVRDNFPEADYTLTDLSPFYLDKARENDEYWRGYRGQEAMRKKRSSSSTSSLPSPANIVQANAEDLPFPDNSFDTVVCVYLFHELPVSARAKAASEMARVCAKGGRVVFSDSIQAGDRDAFPGKHMEVFGKLNEPHYKTYLYDDLVAYFESCGLVCDEKYVNSRTKTFSFTKE